MVRVGVEVVIIGVVLWWVAVVVVADVRMCWTLVVDDGWHAAVNILSDFSPDLISVLLYTITSLTTMTGVGGSVQENATFERELESLSGGLYRRPSRHACCPAESQWAVNCQLGQGGERARVANAACDLDCSKMELDGREVDEESRVAAGRWPGRSNPIQGKSELSDLGPPIGCLTSSISGGILTVDRKLWCTRLEISNMVQVSNKYAGRDMGRIV